jgi:ABC-type Na+ efflux pump permease subunit
MSLAVAISAFGHRGARRGEAVSFLAYSALLTLGLLLLAAWIAPEARLADLESLRMWAQNKPPYLPGLDPSLWTTLALADVLALVLLALAGFVLAPAMVAAAVAAERRAGTLDQLRTTPLSPLALAAGLMIGVPARVYLLCAGPLVLHLAAVLFRPLPVETLVASVALLAAGTAASCALGLCVALAPRQESGGTFAALGVAALFGMFAFTTGVFAVDRHLVAWSYLHPAGALDAVMLAPHGLWRRMALGAWGGQMESEGYRTALSLAPLASLAA